MNEFLKRLERLLIDYRCDSIELKLGLDELILGSAKRIRPKLARLILLANGEVLSQQQELLIASGELLHTASLIHDDIIDGSEFRRGRAAFHKTNGTKIAVIAGDLLAASAMNKILAIGNDDIVKMFQATFEKMCNAEVTQYFERGQIPSLENYIEKSKNKTGSLFSAILSGVAILSKGLNSREISEFGLAFGTAFQLRNDLNSYLQEDSNDKENGVYTAADIFFESIKNKDLAIEKTEFLIDNEKNIARSYIRKLPPSEHKDEIVLMIEDL